MGYDNDLRRSFRLVLDTATTLTSSLRISTRFSDQSRLLRRIYDTPFAFQPLSLGPSFLNSAKVSIYPKTDTKLTKIGVNFDSNGRYSRFRVRSRHTAQRIHLRAIDENPTTKPTLASHRSYHRPRSVDGPHTARVTSFPTIY